MTRAGYIAIDGPIGVGKTTLATRLAATFGARELAEAPDANPFLGAFYNNPRAHALAAQLFFLLQRARQIDDLRQADLFTGGWVADFTFDKDPLFARLTLSSPERALYDDLHARLAGAAPVPDCVIYLHAPIDVLIQRIEWRSRAAERSLSAAYLADVVAAYQQHFAAYDKTRLVRVDADALDLVGREQDYAALLAALASSQRFIDLSAPIHA